MRRKIKVCHVNTRFLSGGGTRNTLLTIKGLDKDRYEIDLIVGRDANLSQVEELESVRLIQIESMVRNPNPWRDAKALWTLYQLFRTNQYDLVHTHLAKAGILGRVAGAMAGVPIIVHSLHGTSWLPSSLYPWYPLARFFYVRLERIAGRFTTCFVPVGEELKNRYLKNGIGVPSRYVVIHSGMDVKPFYEARNLTKRELRRKKEAWGLEEDAVVIGTVARMEPGKGYEDITTAATTILERHPQVRFLFVGDGYNRERIEEQVRIHGLSHVICNGSQGAIKGHNGAKTEFSDTSTPHVIFAGYREDVAEVMALFDVLIFASHWEGLPQVLVQVSVLGKPVITYNVDGAQEIVGKLGNGFIVPLRDVAQLAQRTNDFLDDLNRAREIGLEGQKIDSDSWSVESMVKQTSDLYEHLCQQHLQSA